jgi:O-succinylbenzoic acid--CoA ligase
LEKTKVRELSILAAATEKPSADCLVYNDRAWSFSEIASRASAAIDRLGAVGVGRGQRVALTPRADLDSAVWLFALFELGCPAVLVHPRLTEGECDALIAKSGIDHVIDAPPPEASLSCRAEYQEVPSDRALAVVFTSGTRGVTRGALLSRRAFVASAKAHEANLGWTPDDRWLLSMPPAHIGGLSILTRSLIARRCVVLGPGAFDPVVVSALMARERVTLLSAVPTMLHRLLDLEPRWTPHRELRAVLVGGASFPELLRRRAADRGVPVLATYGCTEACSQVAAQNLSQVGHPGSGAALSGVQVRVRDREIQVRGDVLMDGYVGEDRLTNSWTSDGWFRTGDHGELAADGQIHVHGRLDDMIVTGGENVAPLEVETWLESVPGISSACVFALPDSEWGEVVAAAIVTDPARYDLASLRMRMKRELASHKQPKQVAVLDALPLNRSGKIDRAAVVNEARDRLQRI